MWVSSLFFVFSIGGTEKEGNVDGSVMKVKGLLGVRLVSLHICSAQAKLNSLASLGAPLIPIRSQGFVSYSRQSRYTALL
jgi:hypothetical protein